MQSNSAIARKTYSPPSLKKLDEAEAREFLTSQAWRGDQNAIEVLELLGQTLPERQRVRGAE